MVADEQCAYQEKRPPAIALTCLVLAQGLSTAPVASGPRMDAPDFVAIDAYVQAEVQAAEQESF